MRRIRRHKFKRATAQTIPESGIFEHVHADALGPLPLTRKGNQYVMIFTNRFSNKEQMEILFTSTNCTLVKMGKRVI